MFDSKLVIVSHSQRVPFNSATPSNAFALFSAIFGIFVCITVYIYIYIAVRFLVLLLEVAKDSFEKTGFACAPPGVAVIIKNYVSTVTGAGLPTG